LDGTINFSHGVPIFSVSIAYAEEGVLRLAAVYDPMQDECFSASQGNGSWLNGKPIHVSHTQDLNHSLLVTGFAYDIQTNPENNLDLFARFSLITQGVRRFGSAALDLSYVASGRLDGYWEIALQPYDIAAGALIALEAGGLVSDAWGGPDYITPPCSILAANAQLYPLMLDEILKTRPK
jgi:myo-inositol-1(or 4)-monophosphatase